MANRAFITIEVELSTEHATGREVEQTFSRYILPSIKHEAPPAVRNMKWIRCEEIHDETGKIIFKILPYTVAAGL